MSITRRCRASPRGQCQVPTVPSLGGGFGLNCGQLPAQHACPSQPPGRQAPLLRLALPRFQFFFTKAQPRRALPGGFALQLMPSRGRGVCSRGWASAVQAAPYLLPVSPPPLRRSQRAGSYLPVQKAVEDSHHEALGRESKEPEHARRDLRAGRVGGGRSDQGAE